MTPPHSSQWHPTGKELSQKWRKTCWSCRIASFPPQTEWEKSHKHSPRKTQVKVINYVAPCFLFTLFSGKIAVGDAGKSRLFLDSFFFSTIWQNNDERVRISQRLLGLALNGAKVVQLGGKNGRAGRSRQMNWKWLAKLKV